jgi:hypothetical protein
LNYPSTPSGKKLNPKKMIANRMIVWKIDMHKMCLIIFRETMYSLFLYGGLLRRSSFGVSVARAREARESIIIFTQRSWIAARGDSQRMQAPEKAVARATTLTES